MRFLLPLLFEGGNRRRRSDVLLAGVDGGNQSSRADEPLAINNQRARENDFDLKSSAECHLLAGLLTPVEIGSIK